MITYLVIHTDDGDIEICKEAVLPFTYESLKKGAAILGDEYEEFTYEYATHAYN